MKRTNSFLFAMAMVASSAFGQQQIEVFTQSATTFDSVPGFDVHHYDLSEPERVKKLYAPQLPANETLALAQAKSFFETAAGKSYMAAMRESYRGREKMLQYQLAKIPAIVFEEGRYVIYGSTDLVQAIALYQHYVQDRLE